MTKALVHGVAVVCCTVTAWLAFAGVAGGHLPAATLQFPGGHNITVGTDGKFRLNGVDVDLFIHPPSCFQEKNSNFHFHNQVLQATNPLSEQHLANVTSPGPGMLQVCWQLKAKTGNNPHVVFYFNNIAREDLSLQQTSRAPLGSPHFFPDEVPVYHCFECLPAAVDRVYPIGLGVYGNSITLDKVTVRHTSSQNTEGIFSCDP